MTRSAPHGRVLVVIPTYNELESVAGVIRRLLAAVPYVDVLVVDDASPDGTGALVDGMRRDDSRVHVLHRRGKDGLAAAYLAGFEWSLRAGYDVVVEMDADGSHAPEQLPRLLAALDSADLVLGSRWVAGGSVSDWPKRRALLSRAGNLYVRAALRTRLRDATGGYRAYRREVLESTLRTPVDSRGYCFQVDLAHRAERAGFLVVEVPIDFAERRYGASKMGRDVVVEALLQVTRWGVAERRPRALGRVPVVRPDATVVNESSPPWASR